MSGGLDTYDKRASAAGFLPFLYGWPVPDGTLGPDDRATVAGAYGGDFPSAQPMPVRQGGAGVLLGTLRGSLKS